MATTTSKTRKAAPKPREPKPTKVTTLDRDAARRIGEATRVALDRVADELGLVVKAGGGKYDPTAGTYAPRIEFALPDSAEREWNAVSTILGFDADDYGREFDSRGTRYRITGINLRARSMPIMAERVSDGRTFKFSDKAVRRLLDAEDTR